MRSLYRFKLDGRMTAEVITDVGLTDAIALTVDWIGDSIYWTNRYPGKIEQIGIDGRNRRTGTIIFVFYLPLYLPSPVHVTVFIRGR